MVENINLSREVGSSTQSFLRLRASIYTSSLLFLPLFHFHFKFILIFQTKSHKLHCSGTSYIVQAGLDMTTSCPSLWSARNAAVWHRSWLLLILWTKLTNLNSSVIYSLHWPEEWIFFLIGIIHSFQKYIVLTGLCYLVTVVSILITFFSTDSIIIYFKHSVFGDDL